VVTIGVYVGQFFEVDIPAEVATSAVMVLTFATSYVVHD
jgi:hypothetical protein